jgi:hypothetical protein
MGFGTPGASGAAPTDGAYFQYNSLGQLFCIISYNGTTNTSAQLTSYGITPNTTHEWSIAVTDDNCEFWIDGVLQAIVSLPATVGTVQENGSAYFFLGTTNSATAPTSAQQIKISTVYIWMQDENSSKAWPLQQAAQGFMGYQGQNGNTMGTTALLANSSNPTAAVPTNTTAALGTGLCGNFWSTNILAANTDGIISSYQNPVGSITVTPRLLYITGIRIDSMVQTATTASGPEIFVWSLAFGHTSVSLATTESATAKAPRRIGLGHQSFGTSAPVGTGAQPIVVSFQSPICLNPGEYVATVMKNIGTAGTAGVLSHIITFDCFWE